jgi:hypothetical protein
MVALGQGEFQRRCVQMREIKIIGDIVPQFFSLGFAIVYAMLHLITLRDYGNGNPLTIFRISAILNRSRDDES